MFGKWERSIFGAADLDAMVADGLVVAGTARIPGNEEIPIHPFVGVYCTPISCNFMT